MDQYWSTDCDWFWGYKTSAQQRDENDRKAMWLQARLPRAIIWPKKLDLSDCSMTQTTWQRSSPERQRKPHYGQAHHVFSHRIVEALHEIQVDLKRDKRIIKVCVIKREIWGWVRLWTDICFIITKRRNGCNWRERQFTPCISAFVLKKTLETGLPDSVSISTSSSSCLGILILLT